MHRLLVIFLFVWIMNSSLLSQVRNVNITGTYLLSLTLTSELTKSVLGSPYLGAWTYGEVLFFDSLKLNTLLRYNLYGKELIMIINQDTLGFVKPLNLKHFMLNNRKFIYSYKIGNEYDREYLTADYFEVLTDGKIQLLMNHYIDIELNSYVTNYMGGGGDGREYFVHKNKMYYKNENNGAAREIIRKKKYILGLFTDKRDEIENYIKREHINLKNDDDIRLLFEYYNSIS